jgi:alpha-glucosidase
VLGNHDRSRIASRAGAAKARLAAMLLMTLRGTPTHYYGDELGLADVPIPPALVQDPWEKNVPGLGLGRDPVRTPMPWDAASPEAGFTSGVPWLPLNPDWRTRNVRAQSADPHSDLSLYRQLFTLRRASLALQAGSIRVTRADDQTLAYERKAEGSTLLVALNFGDTPASIPLPGPARHLLSTALDRAEDVPLETLRPYEGVVLAIVG